MSNAHSSDMYGHGVAMERHIMTIFCAPLVSGLAKTNSRSLANSTDCTLQVFTLRAISRDRMIEVGAVNF